MSKLKIIVITLMLLISTLPLATIAAAPDLTWHFSEDFTRVTVNGVEYDNLVLIVRNDWGNFFLQNLGTQYLADPQAVRWDTPEEFFNGGRIQNRLEQRLRTWASMAPCFEIYTINHVPWQDTEWKDFIVEALTTANPSLTYKPLRQSQEAIVDFALNPENLGYMSPMLYSGLSREEAEQRYTPMEKFRLIAYPEQSGAQSSDDLVNWGGPINVRQFTLKDIGRLEDLLDKVAVKDPVASEPEPVIEPLKARVFLYIGNPIIERLQGENRDTITLDAAPYIENSTTFVPLRGALEAVGAEVHWTPEKVTVKRGDLSVNLFEGQELVLKGSRMMVPIRYLSERLGYTVLWHQTEQKVELIEP